MSQTVFGALTIRAGDGARVQGGFGPNDGAWRRRYSVRVHSDDTGADIRFDFTSSAADEQAGKRGLGPADLLYAFRCFVDDAQYAESDLADFLEDLGYVGSGSDVRQGIAAYKACKRSRAKFDKLYSDGRDPADVLERLWRAGVE